MCGHGTIAICIVLVEMGMIEAQQPETETVLDTLAGLVRAKVAVMAVLHGKGELGFNEELVHESILGTLFYGRLIEETKVEPLSHCGANHHWQRLHHWHPAVCPRSQDPSPAEFHLGKEGILWSAGFE